MAAVRRVATEKSSPAWPLRVTRGTPRDIPTILALIRGLTYSTFAASPTLYLEDLFVLSEERGHGAGRALLSALARIAKLAARR